MGAGGAFVISQEYSVVVLDTGAAANLVCFRSLAHHNRILERRGIPRVTTYPSQARFRFGDGRLGEVRHAAAISVGFTAFVLGGGVPALLRKGAMEALGGQLDFCAAR